jgi:hypothetical protein
MPRSHGCRSPSRPAGHQFYYKDRIPSFHPLFPTTHLSDYYLKMSRNEITSVPPLEEKDRDMVDHIEHDTEKNVAWSGNKHMDDAARILHEAGGHREYSVEDRRRVLRRIDIFVCIPMCITYFIQQVG